MLIFYYSFSLTREIVASIGDYVKDLLPESFLHIDMPKLSELVRLLYKTTSPKLLLECILKPIYFQAGLNGKILTAKLSACSLTHEWKWGEVLKLSDDLASLTAKYNLVISRLLDNTLSPTTIKFLIERIRSTINRCGFTPIANQIIQSCSQSNQLLLRTIEPLLSSDRYLKHSIQARKFIKLIFASASAKDINSFLDLIETNFIRKDCKALLNAPALTTGMRIMGFIEFMESFLESYENLSDKYSKNSIDHLRLICAMERILAEESWKLSGMESQSIAFALSNFIHLCLSKHVSSTKEESGEVQGKSLPIASLEQLNPLVKVNIMNKHLAGLIF